MKFLGLCLFINLLSFEKCVIFWARKQKQPNKLQKMPKRVIFMFLSTQVSSQLLQQMTSQLSFESFKSLTAACLKKKRIQKYPGNPSRSQRISVTLGLGPIASRLTGLFVRPVPDKFDGKNKILRILVTQRRNSLSTKPFEIYFSQVRFFTQKKVDICLEYFPEIVADAM